jgi:hypothetical protein
VSVEGRGYRNEVKVTRRVDRRHSAAAFDKAPADDKISGGSSFPRPSGHHVAPLSVYPT